jgi:hypothetical protein
VVHCIYFPVRGKSISTKTVFMVEGSGRASGVPFSKTGDREQDKVKGIEGFLKAVWQAPLKRLW